MQNTTPIIDITHLIPQFKFSTGNAIKPAPGKLGMSLQTPRQLAKGDIVLLQGVIPAAKPPSGEKTSPASIEEGNKKAGSEPGIAATPEDAGDFLWKEFKGIKVFVGKNSCLSYDWSLASSEEIKPVLQSLFDRSTGPASALISDLYLRILPQEAPGILIAFSKSGEDLGTFGGRFPPEEKFQYLKQMLLSGCLGGILRFQVYERGELKRGHPNRILAYPRVVRMFSGVKGAKSPLKVALASVVPACQQCDHMLICKNNVQETLLRRCPHCKAPLKWYLRKAKVHDAELALDGEALARGKHILPISFHGRTVDLVYFDRNVTELVDCEELLYLLQFLMPGERFGPFLAQFQLDSLVNQIYISHFYPQKTGDALKPRDAKGLVPPVKLPAGAIYDPALTMEQRIADAEKDVEVQEYRKEIVGKQEVESPKYLQLYESSIPVNDEKTCPGDISAFSYAYLVMDSIKRFAFGPLFIVRVLESSEKPGFSGNTFQIKPELGIHLAKLLIEQITQVNPDMELFMLENQQALSLLIDTPGTKIKVRKGLKVRACKHCGVMYLRYQHDWHYFVDDFLEDTCPYCGKPRDVVERQCNVTRVKLDPDQSGNPALKSGAFLNLLYHSQKVKVLLGPAAFFHLLEHFQINLWHGAIGPLDVILNRGYLMGYGSNIYGLRLGKLEPIEWRAATLFPEDLLAF